MFIWLYQYSDRVYQRRIDCALSKHNLKDEVKYKAERKRFEFHQYF
ncbi:MAG: hypothetical protein ACJAS9_000202 [Polaribacter sp.]|jgi:hypothetical protein